jgi:uncharacterized cupredoxin-like copper-binding protein
MPRLSGPATWRLMIAVIAGGVLAAGCASGTASPSAAPAQSASPAQSAAAGSVGVELSEWKVVPAAATAAAGPVSFAVTNKGTQVHEFVVVKTDTKADALPVVDNKIDESALTPVDEIEDIAVGASPTLDVTLEAGHYVLLCNIETHYEQGMGADFDVS